MRRSDHPKICTIVLTWNSRSFVKECIRSLNNSAYKSDILVVDNNSADGTRSLVKKEFSNIEVLNTGDNLGYSGGNNFGYQHIKNRGYDYIFILNPDAGVKPDCLGALLERISADKKLAAVSPVIYYKNSDKIWYAGAEINWTTGATPHIGIDQIDRGQFSDGDKCTERLNGCAMLVRTSALENNELFDDAYFLYYEESDLSVRLARAGYSLGIEYSAHVWHDVSSSTGGYGGKTYQYYMTRNKLYFMRKFRHKGQALFIGRDILHSCFELLHIARTEGMTAGRDALNAKRHAYLDYARGRFGRRTIL